MEGIPESGKLAQQMTQWLLDNPSKEPADLPRPLVQKHLEASRRDRAKGLRSVDFFFNGEAFFTEYRQGPSQPTNVKTRNRAKKGARVQARTNKAGTLTVEDYINHPRYKGDPELARRMFEYDESMMDRLRRHSSKENQLDHIIARNNPEDVFSPEHYRNMVLAGGPDNARKGNKLVSKEATDYMGIGRTSEEMIDMAASSPYPRQTPRDRRLISSTDVGVEFQKGMGLSASRGGLKFSSNLGRADQAAQIGVNLATGNVAGAAVGGGIMAATEAAKSKVGQKAIAEILAKRAGKSAAKFVPGVDVAISAAEVGDYLSKGRFDQAGIAAISGLVGWVPGIGDAAAAGLDAVNTGLDIARLDTPGKPDVESKRGGLRYKPRL